MNERDQPHMNEGELESLTTDDQFRKDVARKFQSLDLRLSSQDVAIEQVKESVKADVAAVKVDVASLRNEVSQNTDLTLRIERNTSAMLSMWEDGAAAKRVFCRLADAWRFLLKQVMLPFGVPILSLYGFWYYTTYHEFPAWISAVFKVFMAIV